MISIVDRLYYSLTGIYPAASLLFNYKIKSNISVYLIIYVYDGSEKNILKSSYQREKKRKTKRNDED